LRFKSVDISPVGIIKGNSEKLAAIIEQLSNPYFEFKTEESIQQVIWSKVIVNCVSNSICPLLKTDNGIFYRNETALYMAKRVIAECITVAASKGILLNAEKVTDSLLLISKSSDGQLISTYQDIKNKRKTEIETLNFAIASIADEMRIEDRIKESRLLGELVKLKSDLTLAGIK
jgi:2-dehydropantoate 2-reductase